MHTDEMLGREERGQSIVEFALILPILLLLLAIVFDIGRAMYAYMYVTHSAREAAWVAAQRPWDTNGVRQAALSTLSRANLDRSRASVNVTVGAPGDSVNVVVTYRYEPMLPLPVGALRISASHAMVRLR